MRGKTTVQRVEKRVAKAMPRRQKRSRRRPVLFALGAGALGLTAWRTLRRRLGTTADGYATGPYGTGAPGTATGQPTAGREVRRGEQLVCTGVGLGGNGSGPAKVEPPFGTTPNGGF